MDNNLALVLLITAIGMGLVFAVIILLWIFMTLLVRFTSKPEEKLQPQVAAAQDELKIRAAVAAVAAGASKGVGAGAARFPLPPKVTVSAWQAVLRSHILNKRGSVR